MLLINAQMLGNTFKHFFIPMSNSIRAQRQSTYFPKFISGLNEKYKAYSPKIVYAE